MDIFNLPYDLFPGGKEKADPLIIYKYDAGTSTFKGKSILHTNSISLVIHGEKTIHFAEKTMNVNDGEFHFMSAGNCLAAMKHTRLYFRSILLFFETKVLMDFYLKYDSLIKEIRSKYEIVPQPYISLPKDAFITNYITSLDLLIESKVNISMQMKQLKFEELMLHLLDKYPESVLSFQSGQKGELDDIEIRKAVEANITNNVSVEELAFLCNISLSTFKRRFTKIYGSSPNKWILQKRMEMAKNLLMHYHEKPGEVYYKVGYENHSSFSQSFKHAFGISPKEFQMQQMNVNQ